MNIKDTKTLQISSLDAFAHALGYKRKLNNSYELTYPIQTGANTVSFNTMVRLHNSEWVYIPLDKLYAPVDKYDVLLAIPIQLSAYEYCKVKSYKIVKKVKLQANKHGKIGVQEYEVKFEAEWYYELFIGDDE